MAPKPLLKRAEEPPPVDADHADADRPEVSIVIPTCRRNNQLRRALRSCLNQRTASGRPYEIIVVDNAPDATAAAAVAKVSTVARVRVRYVHEPRAGISHARNTGVADAGGELIAMLDDDERASPDWLWHLTKAQREHEADVVFGPVYPEFERSPERHAEFLARFYTYTVRRPTGSRVGVRSTNNALIRKAGISADEPFDSRLGLTGGEDTLFFDQLRAGGARFTWCAEAHVTEAIAPARTEWRYVWRRSFQRGQCRASTPLLLTPPDRLRTAFWMGVGAVQFFGLLPVAGALWLIDSKEAPYCTWKMIGGLGKLLWMRRFRTQSYGSNAAAGGGSSPAQDGAPADAAAASAGRRSISGE